MKWPTFLTPSKIEPTTEERVSSLIRDNQRLRAELEQAKEKHDRYVHTSELFRRQMEDLASARERIIQAKDAVIDELRVRVHDAQVSADGHLGRIEKIMDYMAVTSSGKTIFAVEPPAPAEQEVPAEQLKSDIDRLMNQPVEEAILKNAVAKVGRRPRAIQKFIQHKVEDEAKARVATQFDDDAADVAKEVAAATTAAEAASA